MRSAPRTNVTRLGSSISESDAPPEATSANHGGGASSKARSGTRKTAPAELRSALPDAGSPQPSDSATNAENASAARIRVPTFPGSETCQSASPASPGGPPRRSSLRKTATTRGGCGSSETPASSAGSTSSSARRTSTGSRPAARPASTRSSPSATKSPSRFRWLADCSRRISRSLGFAAEVITSASV